MNVLLGAMRRSLAELDLGLKGDLTMSEPMEKLMFSLASDQVPAGVTPFHRQQCSRTAGPAQFAGETLAFGHVLGKR